MRGGQGRGSGKVSAGWKATKQRRFPDKWEGTVFTSHEVGVCAGVLPFQAWVRGLGFVQVPIPLKHMKARHTHRYATECSSAITGIRGNLCVQHCVLYKFACKHCPFPLLVNPTRPDSRLHPLLSPLTHPPPSGLIPLSPAAPPPPSPPVRPPHTHPSGLILVWTCPSSRPYSCGWSMQPPPLGVTWAQGRCQCFLKSPAPCGGRQGQQGGKGQQAQEGQQGGQGVEGQKGWGQAQA